MDKKKIYSFILGIYPLILVWTECIPSMTNLCVWIPLKTHTHTKIARFKGPFTQSVSGAKPIDYAALALP